MNHIIVGTSAALLLLGCNTNRVQTLSSSVSPNGKWVIAAEFDGFGGAIVLRDVTGKELLRGRKELVDLPGDYRHGSLKITNDRAGEYIDGRPVIMWSLNSDTEEWYRIDNPSRELDQELEKR